MELEGYKEAKEHFEGIVQGLYRSDDLVEARATIKAIDMVFSYFERAPLEQNEILKQIDGWKSQE